MKVKFAFKPDKPNINNVIFTKEAIEDGAKEYMLKENQYGVVGQPGDDPKDADERAFFIKNITFNGKEFVGDIDFFKNESGDKAKLMLNEGVRDYRIVTLSRSELGDWVENDDSITINKMEFLHVGIVNKNQVF